MPSLSLTSLDRLIETASPSSTSQAGPSFDRSTPFSFYPPLYATPPQQRPPSPTAFSPSPYVLNFKRRVPVQQPQTGGKESKAELIAESPLQQQCYRMDGTQEKDMALPPPKLTKAEEAISSDRGSRRKGHKALTENEVFDMELEKREASAYRGRGIAKENMQLCDSPPVSLGHGNGDDLTAPSSSRSFAAIEEVEFFDAADSVFSESASEDDVYSISIKNGRYLVGGSARTASRLEEEMAKRIKAEENVVLWQRRWNEMAKRCATAGVSLPFEIDSVLGSQSDSAADVLDQELVVARLVGEAIARAVARAEKEEELEAVLGAKNREISRLWDKLQYVELVNREMSQRNQEVTESTQRRKRRRRRRRGLALSGFCAAICIGSAGLLCYKYIPWEQVKGWADSLLKSPASENEST
ncbi:hypothetical protein GOP47_0008513 [Adiantum capillus-veneris]|uniref:Uncharacterized protein n=1 Tax=Adiantum capillus-veneris TaxID=13818 RepID=A0A9D4ZI45_ADICA|nr:hypothetical protein GOP47_0008513 [Adiantum capillus-veneris]